MAEGGYRKQAEETAGRLKGRDLGVLLQLWSFVKPYRLQVGGAFISLLVAVGALLVMGMGLRRLVDEGFAGGDSGLLDRAVLMIVLILVLTALGIFGRVYLVNWIGERVVSDIRKRVYHHVLGLSPAYYEVTKTAEIISRLTTDTTVLQVVIGGTVSQALRNGLMMIGATGFLFYTSPKLTALVLLVIPFVVLPIVLLGRKVRKLSREAQDRVADVGVQVDESLGAIRTVQAFTHEAQDRKVFDACAEEAFEAAARRVKTRSILVTIVIVLVFGAIAAVLWTGGNDVLAGRMSPGELSAFVFYAIMAASSVGGLSEVFGELQRAAGATERLVDLLETSADIVPPASPKSLPEKVFGEIVFEEVVFHYPARPEQAALKGLNLKIEAGQSLALVGPSGAGKSTLFQLLLRFYDPLSGRITLEGLDLKDLDPQDLRARIGLVPQEPVIFSTSALENIRYGRPAATREEVEAAAEAAYCTDFLKALPEGFDTFLGERGVRLSGGQRQRLAIARAILRDPAVLLLDEATSALDSESEKAVQEALERLMDHRTTLIIAHRLATIRKAKEIAVIEEGQLVASGRHEDLIADSEGLYARLSRLQFRGESQSA